ncbi:MAG: hypothetical protein DI573_11995 [Microbacterium sp.]|uniref:hypothetical protein n=1 Tax=Microbacterium sp. TaxID=51671 RepID=UPI000DAFD618|nr:hypothetical protein [Microbacterium sp.]PZU37233.1 MAG: hypothetical protein DI573_11995 [Microbacterium sp.]
MTTDLIGTPLTDAETRLLAVYREVKDFAGADDLAPSTRAALLSGVAALGVAVTDLGLTLEHLTDLGA